MIDAKNQFSNVSEIKINKRDFSQNTNTLNKLNSSNNLFDTIGNKNNFYETCLINKIMGENQMEKNNFSKNKKLKSDSNLKFNLFFRKKSSLKLKPETEANEKKKRKERNLLNNNNTEERLISYSDSLNSISIRNNSKNSSKNTSKNNSPNRNDNSKELFYDEKSIQKNKENFKKSKFKNSENKEKEKKENKKKNQINNYNNIILFNVSKNKNLNVKKKVTFFFGDDKNNSENKNENKLVNQNINFETFHFSIFGVKKFKFFCC